MSREGSGQPSRCSFDRSVVVGYALESRTTKALYALSNALRPRPSARGCGGELALNIAAFRLGLRELGYIEGKTILLEIRLPEGAVERLPQLARELVALKPDVIVATNDVAIASIRRETQTIPIVMVFSSDPAGAGFVASLARPGGNVTGLSTLSPEISGRRLELLREVVPGLILFEQRFGEGKRERLDP